MQLENLYKYSKTDNFVLLFRGHKRIIFSRQNCNRPISLRSGVTVYAREDVSSNRQLLFVVLLKRISFHTLAYGTWTSLTTTAAKTIPGTHTHTTNHMPLEKNVR